MFSIFIIILYNNNKVFLFHSWMGSCCFTTTWMLNCHSNKVPTNWDGTASRICTKSSTYGKRLTRYTLQREDGGLGQWEQWSMYTSWGMQPPSLLYIYASWAHVPVRPPQCPSGSLLNGQVQLCHDIWNYKLLNHNLPFVLRVFG